MTVKFLGRTRCLREMENRALLETPKRCRKKISTVSFSEASALCYQLSYLVRTIFTAPDLEFFKDLGQRESVRSCWCYF